MTLNKYYSITERIPSEIAATMSKTEIRLLELLVSVMKSTHKKSPSGAFYCFPSELWLSRQLSVSRQWISECIQRLNEKDLIIIINRGKRQGRWRTNLYKIGLKLAEIIRNLREWISSFSHRVNSKRHISKINSTYREERIRKKEVIVLEKDKSTLKEVIERAKSAWERRKSQT